MTRAKVFFKRQHEKFANLLYYGKFYTDVSVEGFDLEALGFLISVYKQVINQHLPELITQFGGLNTLGEAAKELDLQAIILNHNIDTISDQEAFSKAAEMLVMMAKLNMAYANFKKNIIEQYLLCSSSPNGEDPRLLKFLYIVNLEINPIDYGRKDLNEVSAQLKNHLRRNNLHFTAKGASIADPTETDLTTEFDSPKENKTPIF